MLPYFVFLKRIIKQFTEHFPSTKSFSLHFIILSTYAVFNIYSFSFLLQVILKIFSGTIAQQSPFSLSTFNYSNIKFISFI